MPDFVHYGFTTMEYIKPQASL